MRVKKLHPDAVIPKYAKPGDSGFDLVAVEDVHILPGETTKVKTGLAFEIPEGFEMQIRPRSGVTSITKLRVQLGTIDAGYRGEVSVIVDNISQCEEGHCIGIDGKTIYLRLGGEKVDQPEGNYLIRKGDRIAQGVIAPVTHTTFEEADELGETERGTGGFGSTGY
ncbi:deoxyuridine 5'-triphosphate nucleotidohydrolase [Paenibacillus ihbetae]|uniref:dUTP diphosphatase n=1 Tax=Paenibacillus ihbetae TaxID=1870820 RepID=A0A1B2DVG8_9BACL|nr:deoxyuridine 5'-triphosphate nucleotidohydrolase [Paenibacillus ihbetae]ANY71681.1 deoxyuridine 5'-triphosphate nucleotidohydrolase [Paenibacillus ihbetae]